MPKYEYRVIPMTNHLEGYKYNVQVWKRVSVNGTLKNVYAGYGRFCKTLDEVKDFQNDFQKEE